jgi:hypothetical protein
MAISTQLPPNGLPFQPTAFGARDRAFFDSVLCSAPWPQLNGNPLGGTHAILLENLALIPLECAKQSRAPESMHMAGVYLFLEARDQAIGTEISTTLSLRKSQRILIALVAPI